MAMAGPVHTFVQDSPEGTTIYYTDPNPLLAVPGKVLFKLTGVLYPYMGVWLLASYMLNAGLGFLILRHARVQPTAALLSAPLFVLVPAFLWRMVHVTLDGHFLVLASIYAYLRMTTVASRTEILLWSAAVGLLTFVNPYLLAMCGDAADCRVARWPLEPSDFASDDRSRPGDFGGDDAVFRRSSRVGGGFAACRRRLHDLFDEPAVPVSGLIIQPAFLGPLDSWRAPPVNMKGSTIWASAPCS